MRSQPQATSGPYWHPSRAAWACRAAIPGHALDPEVVTVQVYLQNEFNLSDRAANTHAAADELPGLLLHVMMLYQQRSPLVVRREDGTHEVQRSETGVRQGDPMGPLLFALAYAYQTTLHEAQERAAEAAVTACHDDIYLQACDVAVIAGARHIMNRHTRQRSKTRVLFTDQSKAEYVAAKLDATVAMRGRVACGSALGYDDFIADHVQR